MNISKTRLKQIIMEEIKSNLTNEDQGQFLRGASGGGGDRIKSRDIQVKADGTFTAALLSKAFDGEIKASGKLDDATVKLPFNPTAENMAQYLVETVAPEMLKGSGVTLHKCVVEETRKCSASYSKVL